MARWRRAAVVCPVLGTITKKSIGPIPIPPNTGKYWPIPNTPIPVSFEPYFFKIILASVFKTQHFCFWLQQQCRINNEELFITFNLTFLNSRQCAYLWQQLTFNIQTNDMLTLTLINPFHFYSSATKLINLGVRKTAKTFNVIPSHKPNLSPHNSIFKRDLILTLWTCIPVKLEQLNMPSLVYGDKHVSLFAICPV